MEERILLMWMICFFANYNTYLTTLLVMVPVLTPLYTVMIVRLFHQTHSNDEDTSEEEMIFEEVEYLGLIFIALIFFIVHYYLLIKDLSLLAIEKHLMADS